MRTRVSRAAGWPAALLLAAIVAVILQACEPTRAQTAAAAPPEVTVAKVAIRDIPEWDEFTGRLLASQTVDVHPRVSGYVETVAFREGARVNRGDLLFRIDPRPFRAEVERLEAEQKRAGAQLDLARSNLVRGQKLVELDHISEEQLDALETAVATAAAERAAVHASLESASLNLEFTEITSPIDGRASRALITAGNLVDQDSLLTTVVADDPLHAWFDADEQTFLRYADIARKAQDGNGGIRVFVGLINEDGHPHEARLDFVDNRVDPDSGTIRGRAVLDNPDGRFTPGLFARIKLVGSETRSVALVDDRAVGTDLDRRYVLVLNEDDVAEYRGVETGRFVDGLRVITEGLVPGDVVIVNGLQRVRPGSPVTPVEVNMADLARTSPGRGLVVAGQ